jgi:DNA-binding transcriptional ArsR family regulator
VNVSSTDKNEFYPTPELKNVLNATNDLYSVITRGWAGERDTTFYSRVMESIEAIRESLVLHSKEIYGMEQALMAAAASRLTEKQQALLRWITEREGELCVYTTLIDRYSEELGVPKSTVRWNLRGLREAGLIVAGDRENKGVPVALTEMGQTLTDYLDPWRINTEHI